MRIAGTLAGLVGVLTILAAIAVGLPAASGEGATMVPLVVGLVAGAGALASAVLLWRRRRLGVLVLALAFALPVAVSLLLGESPQGNILFTVAVLLSAANWKALR